jgi:hypothetical protein
VTDAIEIGARVLDREQTGVQADFVKAEFERAARSVESSFADQAQRAAAELKAGLEAVFGPDSGHLTKALERHFSDDSSAAVQHRVRAVLTRGDGQVPARTCCASSPRRTATTRWPASSARRCTRSRPPPTSSTRTCAR